MKTRRTRIEIYYDILQTINCNKQIDNAITLTRIARMSNLPYDRFRRHMNRLVRVGLVHKEPSGEYVLTKKGLEFIQEHERMSNFLRRMGLTT